MESNEQVWVQLLTGHPDLVRVIAYIFHGKYLDYYFIYSSLVSAVDGKSAILISGIPLTPDLSASIIALLEAFQIDSPGFSKKLNDAFNVDTAEVSSTKMICSKCKEFGKEIFYINNSNEFICSDECKDANCREIEDKDTLVAIAKYDRDLEKCLKDHFGGFVSQHFSGVLTFSIENRQLNLDLLTVYSSNARKGIGSQLISRLKTVMYTIPEGFIFVVASSFENKLQWSKLYILYLANDYH